MLKALLQSCVFVRIFVQIGMFVMMFDICDVYFWEERATVL